MSTTTERPPAAERASTLSDDPIGWARQCIRNHPSLAVTTSMAAGAAVGFVISELIEGPNKPPSRRVADSVADHLRSALDGSDARRIVTQLRDRWEKLT